jgi:NADPH-dependent 2,4-dienoyl-CoA reductase/sulfur reductase-like enzyme
MSDTSSFVIVGAGLAGAKAAETLRAEGFEGRLLLLGEEAERPYERPPLSKAYLRGETDRDSLYVHQDGFYAAHDNEQLEAVGAAGVYAAGDVAAAWHPRYQSYLHVEHWANALNQGPAAARNMLGVPTPYARLPYFYSDQYDLGMEYSGFAATRDRVVVRGEPAARRFIAFWLKDQRVVAGMNANVWDVTEPIQALIRSGLPVDPARLADPDIPLDQVTGALMTRSTR